MPEGPEVECVKLELEKLLNKKVATIQLTDFSQKYAKYKNKQIDFNQFKDTTLLELERHGKFIIWRFSIDTVVLNHLGMTGKWFITSQQTERDLQDIINHPKVIITFKDNEYNPTRAIFDDTRNFGQFRIFPDYQAVLQYRSIKKLGVDGLATNFDLDGFLDVLNEERYEEKEIGSLLLNQRLVAGVGNIYKSESLFKANIHPKTLVKTLSKHEKKKLGLSINKILRKAVQCGGSTFGNGSDQRYTLPSGEEGSAQNWHKVYDREGKPCKNCNSVIQKIKQRDRSTFFCEKCQT